MKIYVTVSRDVPEAAEKYIAYLIENGHEVCRGAASGPDRSDALCLCISGKDNAEVKADLNMALERNLPVAYTMEKGGAADAGLKFQLGLEKEIPAGDLAELSAWLGKAEAETELRKKKKKSGRVRKAVIFAAAVILLPAGFFGAGKLSANVKTGEETGQETAGNVYGKNADAEAQADKEAAEKYLGMEPSAVKVLDLSGKGLADISFLAEAVNLEELDISNNQITDINVLVTLKHLKKVNISGNPVGDDTILKYMEGLEVIR